MFIITIKVPYNEITSPNDYHKIIHTIFHKPTDNIKTPTFSVINEDFDGININVYNDYDNYFRIMLHIDPEFLKYFILKSLVELDLNYLIPFILYKIIISILSQKRQ